MRRVTLILWLVLLAGCRTFEIGFVQTPTPVRIMATPASSPTLPATAAIAQPIVESTATATITPTATRRPMLRPTSNPIAPAPTSTSLPGGPAILNFSVEPLEVDP